MQAILAKRGLREVGLGKRGSTTLLSENAMLG